MDYPLFFFFFYGGCVPKNMYDFSKKIPSFPPFVAQFFNFFFLDIENSFKSWGRVPKNICDFFQKKIVISASRRPKVPAKNSIFLSNLKNSNIFELPDPKIGEGGGRGLWFGPKSNFYPGRRGAYPRGTALGEEIKYGVSRR